jgi:hypothetical protein
LETCRKDVFLKGALCRNDIIIIITNGIPRASTIRLSAGIHEMEKWMKREIAGLLIFLLMLTFMFATVGISEADYQGTIGMRVTITDSGFGIKKPKVYIQYEKKPGVVKKEYAKVEAWSDTSITFSWTKTLASGAYNLWVKPNSRGSSPLSAGKLTIMPPEINNINPQTLAPGSAVTIDGKFFTSKKPKVYLKDLVSLKKKKCRIITSTMDPETGESSLNFVVPKWGSGNYEIILKTLVSEAPYVNPSTNPLDIWHSRNPLPQGNTLNGVAFGNGIFVAVGQLGTVMTSSDGLEWQISQSGIDNNLSAVAFGNGMFATVGNNGVILTSSEGVDWTPRTSETDSDLYDVTFGEGVFVVVGGDKILTSPDGVYWTTFTLTDPSFSVFHITYGNEIFIGVGVYTLITSTDGVHWSGSNIQQNPLDSTSRYSYAGVVYAHGFFYLINHHGSVYADTYSGVTLSVDGLGWELTNVECMASVAYGNGTSVMVNDGCPSRYRSNWYIPSHSNIATSSDGKVWADTSNSLEDGIFLKDITYGKDIFVAVGSNGVIFTSP